MHCIHYSQRGSYMKWIQIITLLTCTNYRINSVHYDNMVLALLTVLNKTHLLIYLYNLQHIPTAFKTSEIHVQRSDTTNKWKQIIVGLSVSAALIANLSEWVSFLAMSENLHVVLSMFVCARNDVRVTFSTSWIYT